MNEASLQPDANLPTESGHAPASPCPNCGSANEGKFCTQCGQKQIHDGDLTAKHVWHHLVHELFHVDGKIFNTLKLLFTRPGQLTLDFLARRRARHVHPIRLFLLVGFVFFLFAQAVSPIDIRIAFRDPTNSRGQELEKYFADLGTTSDQFATEANARSAAAFKTVFTLAILFQGFGLWVVFRRQRPYLAENMVMALHLACFNMAAWVALGSLKWANLSMTVPKVGTLVLGVVYFVFAARRVYGGSWPSLVLKWAFLQLCSSLVIAVALAIIIFRLLLAQR